MSQSANWDEQIANDARSGKLVDAIHHADQQFDEGSDATIESPNRLTMLQILHSSPSPGLFKSPEDADEYVKHERDSWNVVSRNSAEI
jgi:hypothetical protein